MVLGITEDFTSEVSLDSQLTATPTNGLYVNSGVHPSITVENLLAFLPNIDYTISAWDSGTTYGKFETTRSKTDLVTYNSVIYQSLTASNTNNQPDVSSSEWLATNIESLRLKTLLYSVLDKVYADLSLTRRLVNNQYVYEVGRHTVTLPEDYSAFVIEPKGSDYLTFTINQIAFQKDSSTPVNLFVVNQGSLVDTLTLTPTDGTLEFSDLGYTFSGVGQWFFAIESTDVIVGENYFDPSKFDGFTCYTAHGTGASAQAATYSYSTTDIGIGMNISVSMDASTYITNNISSLGNFIRATFEYTVFQTFLHNPNNRSNRVQRIQMDDKLLAYECKNIEKGVNTVASRYMRELSKAKKLIEKTFDNHLSNNENDIEVEISSV